MRITVRLGADDDGDARSGACGVDVEVPDGARLGDLRAHLAAVSGDDRWTSAATRPHVGPHALGDDHLCGHPPLLPGAELRPTRGREDAVRVALGADRHVAVVGGPGCGDVRAVTGRTVLGGGVEVRVRRRRAWAAGRRSVVGAWVRAGDRRRVVDARDGRLLLRRGRARPRRLGGRWTRWRTGDQVVVDDATYELRRHPGSATSRRRTPDRPSPSTGPTAVSWLAPAAAAAAFAVATGHPWMLLLGLAGPAVALGPLLVARRRRAQSDRAARAAAAEPADVATRTVLALDRALGGAATPPPATTVTRPAPPVPEEAHDDPLGLGDVRAAAVIGPRGLAVAVAAGLAAVALGPGSRRPLVVRCDPDAGDWAWCRWLADDASGALPARSAGGALVLVDGARAARHPELARWWHAAGPADALVMVVPSCADVPAWCAATLTVPSGGIGGRGADHGAREATLQRALGLPRTVPLRPVTPAWADRQARRIAALRVLPTPPGTGSAIPAGTLEPPRAVRLGDLPGVPRPDAGAVVRSWARAAGGLRTVLGAGPGGAPVEVDLVRDGPHVLVAGTTGAGKSALLQTLVLGLALRYPPDRLAVAVIDFKGGAGLGACVGLPHVVGQVTDLDGGLTTRAVDGLRAELRRREALLASAGVDDLDRLWASPGTPPPPPRLLVVVDELRALADDLPDALAALLRLAAQGRSLGIHLVLATQRPGGAVGPDLRANLTLRIALRVTDPAESRDVVDVPDAAFIDPAVPGRAVLRRGPGPVEEFQVARAVTGAPGPVVRPAAPWPGSAWTPEPPVRTGGPDGDLRRWVDAAAGAASAIPAPHAPWLPPLPRHVGLDGLDPCPLAHPPRSTCLPVALADLPEEASQATAAWHADGGHLLVLGGPGSGRSTTLRTLAVAALDRGWHVHALGLPAQLLDDLRSDAGLGTVAGHDEALVLAALVGTLDRPDASAARRLLLVDDLPRVVATLARVARGAAVERFAALLRDARSRGVAVAATATPTSVGHVWAAAFPERLVLPSADGADDVLAGVPAGVGRGRRDPGRAVHVPATDDVARLCQVATTARRPAGTRTRPRPSGGPPRLRPVPGYVPGRPPRGARRDPSRPPRGDRTRVVVGRGGDDAGDVHLDLSRSVLVVGPGGSGRSTAVATIAAGLLDAGRPLAAVGRDPLPPTVDGAGVRLRSSFDPAELGRLLDAAARLLGGGEAIDLVVDDLDVLEQVRPVEHERLADLVLAHRLGAVGAAGVLVASARTVRAAGAFREPLAGLRSGRQGIVLSPHEPGSAEVFGTPLDWVLDPDGGRAPGRGAVQRGREVLAVQVADVPRQTLLRRRAAGPSSP